MSMKLALLPTQNRRRTGYHGRTFDAKISAHSRKSTTKMFPSQPRLYLDIDSAMVFVRPIVVDGVAYVSAPQSKIYAVNAAPETSWKFDPRVRLDMPQWSYSARTMARRRLDGKVFVARADCRLVAVTQQWKETWKATFAIPRNGELQARPTSPRPRFDRLNGSMTACAARSSPTTRTPGDQSGVLDWFPES